MPAPFPWQQHHWSRLMERVRSATLPHGVLLAGPEGLGKRRFAEELAAAVLCQDPDDSGEACGRCQACMLRGAGTHPDLHHLAPEGDSRVIKIDQVRQLIANMGLTSRLGGYRVAILDPAERMTTEAANSLLKTLEEPGASTLLILVSGQMGLLPATVRSRCQIAQFSLPPAADAEAWLRRHTDHESPALALSLAGGAPLKALTQAEAETLEQRRQWLRAVSGIAQGRADPLAVAAQWQKADVAACVGWLRTWVEDLIRLKACTEPPRLTNRDAVAYLQRLAEALDWKALFERLERVQEGGRLVHTQVNGQTILEGVLIPWRNAPAGR